MCWFRIALRSSSGFVYGVFNAKECWDTCLSKNALYGLIGAFTTVLCFSRFSAYLQERVPAGYFRFAVLSDKLALVRRVLGREWFGDRFLLFPEVREVRAL